MNREPKRRGLRRLLREIFERRKLNASAACRVHIHPRQRYSRTFR